MEFLKPLLSKFSRNAPTATNAPAPRRCSLASWRANRVSAKKTVAIGATAISVALSGGAAAAMPTAADEPESEKRNRSERKATDFAQQYLLDSTKGNIFLLYQPIVSSHTGELTMVEGLVRWNDSRTDTQRGAPEVLHAAAMTDTLFDLTRITIERGMADLAAIHEAGLSHVGIAINLNPEQLCDESLVPFVREVLAQTHIAPHHLTLEVTEDAILHDEDIVVTQLRALDQLGVGLAIDDFGVGYSSLARLQQMPFDSVKIDKIFLENVPAVEPRAQFYKAIVDFIHAIGIEPVAEGVETEAQRTFVREIGCGMLQGFAESTPLPLHALLEDYAPLRANINAKKA
jgi:EAL domain-containing protein (putative c-di-GMP-specific phosphodiesterase class I)